MKVSNLFELLLVSSNDGRFGEWVKCFELIFDISADQIMTDYYELFTLINATTIRYEYEVKTYFGDFGDHFDWLTFLPNRNRVFFAKISRMIS